MIPRRGTGASGGAGAGRDRMPKNRAASRAARLVCALCLLAATGWGAGEVRAQGQQEWQILQQRLQNLESDFAALRATFDLQASERAEAGGTEVILRLARVEEMLRENAGAMENLSFQVQQLQEGAEAYRKDSELRFQELEERLAAAETAVEEAQASAAAANAAAQAAAETAAAIPAAAEPDATADDGLPSGVTASATEGPVPVSAPDVAEEAFDEVFVVTGESLLDPGVAPDAAAEATPEATAEEAPAEAEEDAAFMENPFPDFTPEPEAEPEPRSDSSIAQTSGLVTDVDPELLPKPLGVIPADATDAGAAQGASLATDTQGGVDPRRVYRSIYALLEQEEFQADAGLQEAAITGFRDFVAAWPQHELAPDAQYWIGEIFYIQENHVDAAEAFLEGMKNYGSSRRAGDTMLKLGITLRLLEQPEKACAAFDELLFTDRFGRLSESARRRIDLERRLANC